jgi:hypothetical protein
MKQTLTALAAAVVLAGCAKAPIVNTYSYESEVHDGTVYVHDLSYGASDKCPKRWREAEQVYKSGLPPMVGMHLKVKVTVDEDGLRRDLPLLVGSGEGEKVTLKDFQEDKALLVGVETNGLVKQGDLFVYPEGYFIRAAKPDVKVDDFSLCLGIDRMYADPASVAGGAPTLKLDRLNILFEGERNEVKTYRFGANDQLQVQVSVVPH